MAVTLREESSCSQAGTLGAELALRRGGTERLIHQQSFQLRLFSCLQTCSVRPLLAACTSAGGAGRLIRTPGFEGSFSPQVY